MSFLQQFINSVKHALKYKVVHVSVWMHTEAGCYLGAKKQCYKQFSQLEIPLKFSNVTDIFLVVFLIFANKAFSNFLKNTVFPKLPTKDTGGGEGVKK